MEATQISQFDLGFHSISKWVRHLRAHDILCSIVGVSASEGATKISMTSMLMGAGLNVVLEPIFIYTFQWGIKGSAIATVIAQGVTTLLYVWYISSGKSNLHMSIKHFSIDKTIYVQILKIGIPTLLFQLLSSTSMGLTNTASSYYGDSAVAAMGVVTRVLALGSYVIFGYAKGFQAVAGFNFGAKNYKRLREAILVSLNKEFHEILIEKEL